MSKIKLIGISFLFASMSIYSIDTDTEIKLLRKALVEGSNSKSSVTVFMNGIAAEKRKEAEKLRQMANAGFGGKFMSGESRKKELLHQAEILEQEAKNYESISKE